MITSIRQFEVATLLDDKGPLRARELNATGSLLALMERRGVVRSMPGGTYNNSIWTLTTAGKAAVRRFRKLHPDWLRPKQ